MMDRRGDDKYGKAHGGSLSLWERVRARAASPVVRPSPRPSPGGRGSLLVPEHRTSNVELPTLNKSLIQRWTFDVGRSTFKILLLLLALCASTKNVALAADDDDEDSQPGLVARYTAGDKTIDRIDRDVQFVWGTGSPNARLPAGP